MNIVWATPVGRTSAIGYFGELVSRALVAEGAAVVIAALEDRVEPSECRAFADLSVMTVSDLEAQNAFDRFDALIVNFGDHYPNHAGALKLLNKGRVVGVFHDADMTNFGNGARAQGNTVACDISTLSGGTGVTAALAARCDAAVAHADFYKPFVEQCDGPVDTIPLAWELPREIIGHPTIRKCGQKNGRFRLLTFGNINPNKCVDRVIEAIGSSESLASSVEYRVVGSITPEYEAKLADMAVNLGVHLEMTGAVEQSDLHEEIMTADCVSCLRYPVLEGASASAIEAMLHGRPLIVSDGGFYSGLPDHCVCKVPETTPTPSIANAIETLFLDAARRQSLGRNARLFANGEFSPGRYAQRIIELVEKMQVTWVYENVLSSTALQLAELGSHPHRPDFQLILETLEGMAPVARRA